MKSITVIICTYNPDIDILARCLNAITEANQVYPIQEILLIDNNSTSPLLENKFIQNYLQKQLLIRIISESNQGLTFARLAGITNASSELFIFIDDDNIIRKDYFMEAAKIVKEYPFIGAFSGQVCLVYDQPPAQWTRRYWGMLVHRLFTGNRWGNILFDNHIMPNGAGLCVFREVALYYKSLHDKGSRTTTLDRSGQSLMSGGDNDLAMCACDIGLGMGLFENLYLDHYIPANRFTLDYLRRLTEGIYFSGEILKYMRNGKLEYKSKNRKYFDYFMTLFKTPEDAAIVRATYKGLEAGAKYVKEKA